MLDPIFYRRNFLQSTDLGFINSLKIAHSSSVVSVLRKTQITKAKLKKLHISSTLKQERAVDLCSLR